MEGDLELELILLQMAKSQRCRVKWAARDYKKRRKREKGVVGGGVRHDVGNCQR